MVGAVFDAYICNADDLRDKLKRLDKFIEKVKILVEGSNVDMH